MVNCKHSPTAEGAPIANYQLQHLNPELSHLLHARHLPLVLLLLRGVRRQRIVKDSGILVQQVRVLRATPPPEVLDLRGRTSDGVPRSDPRLWLELWATDVQPGDWEWGGSVHSNHVLVESVSTAALRRRQAEIALSVSTSRQHARADSAGAAGRTCMTLGRMLLSTWSSPVAAE